jgi:TrfA protein
MSSEPQSVEQADMIRRIENMRRMAQEKEEREGKPPKLAVQKSAEIVQLDFWDDGKRAAPNAILRSALFPALATRQKETRRFLKNDSVFSVSGLDVFFTGEQFDQSDLDIYLELLNLAQPFPLGTPIKFSAYGLLKALGLSTGGENHVRLHAVLVRLRGGTLDVTDHNKRYFGGLIEGGIRDELSLNYEITINPKFAILFGFGMWATIDKEQRRALGRDSTAKALHAYYSSHTAPAAHNYETLAELAGLKNSNKRQTKNRLIKAHEHLKDVGFLENYEPETDKIKPIIRHTAGQLRHIAKKARKPRKP